MLDHAILFEVFGVIGFGSYISGYGLLQLGWICGAGNTYRWMQLAGATFMLISLSQVFHLGSVLIQSSYILITLVGFIRARRLARLQGRDRVLRARRAARQRAEPLVLTPHDRAPNPDPERAANTAISPQIRAVCAP